MRPWVRPTALPEEGVEALHNRGRRVLYVLERRSLADVVALTIVCWAHALPAPARRLKHAAGYESQSVVAMDYRRQLFGGRVRRHLPDRLVRVFTDVSPDHGLAVDLVPVSVFWGRAPGRERTGIALFLNENAQIVGSFTRLMAMLFRGRRTLVRFGEPMPLADFVTSDADPARSARRALRALRIEFRKTRAAIIGPDLTSRAAIIAAILKKRAVRAAMAAEMRDKKISRAEVINIAANYVDEIAANYSSSFVAVMAGVLSKVWQRLYDGVDVLRPERLELASSGSQVVYVPCHRSHMDYLLLSYVIYSRGYAAPYVAAGINLNIPIVGWFLRKGGAFFLRRSFKGNALYPIVFMTYLRVMMSRGHPIQYFIEGGRSRTGRLLQPKTGMLSMTVRSFLADPTRPVIFVPVYFGYERLVEASTYISELSGRPKQKESLFGLLRSLTVLRQRFGRVSVSFGEPLSLSDHLDGVAHDWKSQLGDDRPSWLNTATDSLATAIQVRVNEAAALSPIALLSLVLLSSERQAMPVSDVLRSLTIYKELAHKVPYAPNVWCTPMSPSEILAYGTEMGIIEVISHALGDVVRMRDENGTLCAYYRNNILHVVVLPSLIACAFLNNERVLHADLHRLIGRIYAYVAAELFLRWSPEELPTIVDRLLDALVEIGLLIPTPDRHAWYRPASNTAEAVQLSHLAHASLEVIERYYLTIALLLQAGSDAISQEALEDRCHQMASRMSLLYEMRAPEFFDRALFRQFITRLRARKVIEQSATGQLIYGDYLIEVARDARYVLSAQIQHSILQVTHD
jgi:glycerol-3-phosphate O-acyltransferase